MRYHCLSCQVDQALNSSVWNIRPFEKQSRLTSTVIAIKISVIVGIFCL
jgi:hypothetical protein